MKKDIAIVIPCYNRPRVLARLLNSIYQAYLTDFSIDIVFSIDYSGNDDVYKIVDSFNWEAGKKKVIKHSQNIGLEKNIIFCGDLTSEYDAVIVLEDDLVVAKDFLNYAFQAYDYYVNEPNIAGISLYKYEYCEFGQQRFYPMELGFDTYFVQWPSSWGQMWTKMQWKSFKRWYLINNQDISSFNIPDAAKSWLCSWKKYYAAYLVDTNKYFVYPFFSFTNMFPTVGVHFSKKMKLLNTETVSLYQGVGGKYNFLKWEDCSFFYDCYFELKSIWVDLNGHMVEADMDLYGSKFKKNIEKKYVISSLEISNAQKLKSWGGDNIPFELNVLQDCVGNFFYMYNSYDYKKLSLKPNKKLFLRVRLSNVDRLKLFFIAIYSYLGRYLKRN